MPDPIHFNVALLDPETAAFGYFRSGVVIGNDATIAGLPLETDVAVRSLAAWMAKGDWRPVEMFVETDGAKWRISVEEPDHE